MGSATNGIVYKWIPKACLFFFPMFIRERDNSNAIPVFEQKTRDVYFSYMLMYTKLFMEI